MLKLFSFAQTLAVDTVGALRRREEGQTMAEYGVVLAVITLAVIAAITLLAGNVSNAINSVANILPYRGDRSQAEPGGRLATRPRLPRRTTPAEARPCSGPDLRDQAPYFRIVEQYVEFGPNGPPQFVSSWNCAAWPKSFVVPA